MGSLRRYRTLALILLGCLAAAQAGGQGLPPGFYDRPVLAVDPGRHTGPITRADVDVGNGPSAAGRFAVTGSFDKTARVWSLATGALERTIRLPAGPGDVGKAYAVAIDPAAEVIAVGGWTTPPGEPSVIYLFARATGALLQPIGDLPDVVFHLAFSPDGRYLAATLGGRNGVRVFDRDRGWAEVARDGSYGDQSYGAAFAPDGRLATTSLDGMIRLYGRDFALPPRALRAPGGDRPFGVAFSRDGARLAVGYDDSTRVDVLDGHSLVPLHAAATEDIDNGDLSKVAWATDGTLLAGGRYDISGICPVLAWGAEGRGARRVLPAGFDTVMSLRPLSGGDLLVAAQDPWLGRLAPDGTPRWIQPSPLADFRDQNKTLAISPDGTVVDFGFVQDDQEQARFDLGSLTLAVRTAADGRTAPPKQDGLPVDGWYNTFRPTLNGSLLPLDPYERSRSLALHPKGDRFVLGTNWALRAFDAKGNALWHQPVPGIVWAVNVTGDGRLAVAAYADGTIRWHRMDDGREILAFMPFADRTNWVAWTPEGFYAASPGAHGVLRWVVNQPDWQPAKDYAVADIPGFYRPEAIKLVLQAMETPRAIGLAVIAEQRRKVQILTNSRVPPGARLHVLAIGVSHYNEQHGAHLRLKFAQKDAQDVIAALGSTQEGLYAAGSRQYLADEDATRGTILRGLDTLEKAMTGRDDLAVVHFAGHGAMVDGELYLLPQDVDAGDAVAIRTTALPVAALRAALLRIAATGRVLVLLDACYSGGASLAGGAQEVASAVLGQALAAANVTVLTSSSASQTSREDTRWQNGAFTKAVLEALGSADADENKDGLLSATELARYVDRRVRNLTAGGQSPAMEIHFDGTLFALP